MKHDLIKFIKNGSKQRLQNPFGSNTVELMIFPQPEVGCLRFT